MHHDNEVRVFTDGPEGSGESPAGVGWLVTPSVVVMRQPGRGATPGLPWHISVPAASGGGRADGTTAEGSRGSATAETIEVLGVYDSEVAQGWLALLLDREASAMAPSGAAPEGLDLSALTVSDFAATDASLVPSIGDDGASTDSWLCRCFPRLPGCR